MQSTKCFFNKTKDIQLLYFHNSIIIRCISFIIKFIRFRYQEMMFCKIRKQDYIFKRHTQTTSIISIYKQKEQYLKVEFANKEQENITKFTFLAIKLIKDISFPFILLRLGALLNLYFSRGLNAPPVFKFQPRFAARISRP